MVQLCLRLKAPAGHRRDIVQALRILRLPTQLNGGCACTHLYCEVDNQDDLCYIEDWPRCEDLTRDVRSDRFSRLLALMETAAEPPVLEFRFVSETRGLDLVEQVRVGTIGQVS